MSRHFHGLQRGFSFVEGLCAMTIACLLVGLLLPSLQQLRDRATVRSVAAQLETDLQFGRSTAVTMNRTTHMTFTNDSSGSCYVLHAGASRDDCRCATNGQHLCASGADVLRASYLGPDSGIRLSSTARAITFEPLRGVVTPTATVSAESRLGNRINVIINVLGRVRTCTSTRTLDGQPGC